MDKNELNNNGKDSIISTEINKNLKKSYNMLAWTSIIYHWWE